MFSVKTLFSVHLYTRAAATGRPGWTFVLEQKRVRIADICYHRRGARNRSTPIMFPYCVPFPFKARAGPPKGWQ